MFHIDKSDLTRPILIKVNAYGFNSNSRFYTINDFSNDFTLIPNVLKLPDVIVKNKPQMIRKIGDTLSYSVDAFAVKSDKTIGDVLKKIPGIEVTAKGQIFFNGLPINYFYIDGDNLLDDKYNIATSTIPYDLVDKIQVIEHNQHIKILEGISEGQSPA
ncbi:MAG: carboxypeptidase regulatory-like domain-containing protein, partial [bacterium]